MEPRKCYICNEVSILHSQALQSIKLKHSQALVWEFIVKLSRRNADLEKRVFEGTNESLEFDAICIECLRKIEEHDLACVTAQRIENELFDLLENTKLVLASKLRPASEFTVTKNFHAENNVNFKEESIRIDDGNDEHFGDITNDWNTDTEAHEDSSESNVEKDKDPIEMTKIDEDQAIQDENAAALSNMKLRGRKSNLIPISATVKRFKCPQCPSSFDAKPKLGVRILETL